MPGAFSQYPSLSIAPPKFARKQHQHQHQHQHQRAPGPIHARVASVDMDRLMDRFWSFGHPQTTPTPVVDLPAPQQAPAPYSGWTWTYPDSGMEDQAMGYLSERRHQHSEPAYEYKAYQYQQREHEQHHDEPQQGHHHQAHYQQHHRERPHPHALQHHYHCQHQHQHLDQQSHYEHQYEQHQPSYSSHNDATHHHQHDHHDQHHHHQHAQSHSHSQSNPLDYNQTHPASPSPDPTPLVSTRRHEQVFVPAYDSAYGTDSHRPQSNAHNGNNDGRQYTQSPYVYVHQSEPQQEQYYAASPSPSPSSSSYSSASSSSSSLHHYPSSSSSSWASSSSYSHQYPLASSSSSSWASSSSSSPAPETPLTSSYSPLSPFSSPAPQPQSQPHPQPKPQPEPQPGPRTRTRTRKAASKSTQSYHTKAAVKCKAAAKANIFRRVVNSPLDAPTPETCTAAAKAAADAASSPSSSLPLPRRRRRPSPASGPSIPIPERKPPKNAAALAKLFRCPDGTYLHVRHYTDFPIPDDDNANSNANANANSQPKTYVPDEHLHLFWRSALAKFDPPDDTRWMSMARDTGVRRSGKQVWTCTAMVMDPKAGAGYPHPRLRPCGHTRAKSTLIRHINDVHINIRNYRCPWNGCKESFHHRFQLETHVFSMHTFESPYECPTRCGATFKDRAVLSKHRSHVHGCPCTLCPARFGDSGKLAAHWLKAPLGQPVPELVPMGSPITSAESCEDEDEEDVDSMDESE